MASKMYILVRDDVDLGHAILAAAHASLGGYLTFIDPDQNATPINQCLTMDWAKTSFRKVVCKVTPEEFEKSKTYDLTHRVMTESGLGGMETAIVFAPREDWPNFFKSLKLYK